MGDVLVRKCAKCKCEIVVDVDDIKDVVKRGQTYYHKQCFIQHVEKKAETKSADMWKKELDNISFLEEDAKVTLQAQWAKDALNHHLLRFYDVVVVPNRFFQMVADLNNGEYKKKRCKSISTKDLLDAWVWGQHNLDKIARNNKAKHIGPKTDSDRIMYDLAIIVGKMPVFFEQKKQQAAAKYELENTIAHVETIDMSKIGQAKQETRRDISDIADDLFVE